MPPKASDFKKSATSPVYLITGDDDFAVKGRAKELYEQLCKQSGGFDNEVIDATASNSGAAMEAIGKLREAMQTLPFLGTTKVIWFQDCNFLGEERTATSQVVTEALGELAEEFKSFGWDGVRLIVTSPKVDKRKVFFKAIDKIGTVEIYQGWSLDSKDWVDMAEMAAREQLRSLGKKIEGNALLLMVERVGPNSRALTSEVEKLSIYLGARETATVRDVETIVSRNKQAKAFALADALAARDLPRLLKTLDEELWMMETDSKRSEIGVLYGVISKVRIMILLKEMVKEGWLRADADYGQFKTALERIPPEQLPKDKKYNPQAMHPFMLQTALAKIGNYTTEELVRAMELLLDANMRLVSEKVDEALVLQETLIKIVHSAPQPTAAAA